MSRMCEMFAGRFVGLNTRFKHLWRRLEDVQAVMIEEKEKASV